MRHETAAITLLATLTLGGQSRSEALQPAAAATPTPPAAPTLSELRNATYAGFEDLEGPVTLADGVWEGQPYAPGSASRPSVRFGGAFRVLGDLDGDGAAEAVVVLGQSSGGSGTLSYLAVVRRGAQGLENVTTTALGDRVAIRSARIESGALHVKVVRAAQNDPMCCPGELAELAWTLVGGELVRVPGSAPTERLTLAALTGSEWVLRAWKDGEPAPAEPEVTLSYGEGRFAGTSGCNRYTASATMGDLPGDLAVGPVAGTRMACPKPAEAVEARFLKQLGGARKFGFLLGELALTYEGEGGVGGTMLFEERQPGPASEP
jgi:heat shock protein HslJ